MSTSTPHPGPPDGPELLPDGHASATRSGRGRRGLLVGGAAVAVAGLVGGGAWALTSFLGAGAQPAEALPATTLGYASIDLDPSGQQKVEALRTLREFPAFREHVGLEADDDLRRYLFDHTLGEAGCEGLDYDDDIEPWLGHRAAVAAVPGVGGDAVDGGAAEPTPVVVLQVSDAAAAEDGLAAVRDCAAADTGGTEEVAWVVEGEWAVLAPSTEEAEAVVTAAEEEGTLADDADFTRWGEEIGDAGVVMLYASPAVGEALLEHLEALESSAGTEGEPGALDGMAGLTGPGLGGPLPEEAREQLEAFEGAAVAVRFGDGGLEVEVAAGAGEQAAAAYDTDGGALVASLPADTAAALGLGLREGWAQDLLDQLESGVGDLGETFFGMSFDDLVATAEQQSGLEIPEDVETLLGESVVVAVGGDFSLEAADQSPDGTGVPVGLKVRGDAEEIQRVLGDLQSRFGTGPVLDSDAEGDTVAVGPDADYRDQLLGDGGLGESETFTDVVPEADEAAGVLFLDLDASFLEEVARSAGDEEVAANLDPLSALGLSAWAEDGVVHASLRVSTD